MAPADKVTCNKCAKNINLKTQNHIFCEGDCKKVWHLPKCITIESSEYEEIVKDSEKPWFCELCKRKREQRRIQRRSVINTTVNADQQLLSTPSTSSSSINNPPNSTNIINNREITLPIIYDKLLELSGKNTTIERAIEDLKKTIEDYKRITDSLIDDNECLRNENTTLRQKVNNIEYALDTNLQEKLNNNIVINGIQTTENENPEIYVEKIAEALQITLTERDIKSITRMQTQSKHSDLPPSIIVEFHKPEKRDEIMQKKKQAELHTNIFGIDTISKNKIYISEQLTSRRQYIMKMARDLRRDKIVEFVWSKQGEIFIRRMKGSKAVKIKHTEELTRYRNDA